MVVGRIWENIDDPSIALDVEDMLAASDDLVGRRLSRNRGTMYQADIDASPDELLDWDLPLYEQSEYTTKHIA